MIYTLPHIVDNSAARFPEREAFRFASRSLTYSELLVKTNQVATLLIELGIRKGDRVGIYMNRSLETAIAIYGIMKAGAAYVPFDPYIPVVRSLFLIENCGIEVLISKPDQQPKIQKIIDQKPKLKAVLGISTDWPVHTISWEEIFKTKAESGPNVNILEQDLAYILYTSGSTGVPKGIMHTHYSGLAYAKLSADLYELTENDRIGNHAPIHFDISTFGYFSGPLVGATTIIIPEAYLKLPASLSGLMEKEKMTVWYSVPLALIQLLQRGILEKKDLSTLRWVLYAGESFPVKHLRKLMEQWPDPRYSNIYGPTELNQCTFYHIPSKIDETVDAIPLGREWKNTELMVVDENDREIKAGETGELLVRSATMMKGYWGRPDLTKKALYKCRVNGVERVFYRTGDLVHLLFDGNLIFVGRKDHQIKIRGYRVELNEIEVVLMTHNGVEEAAVFSVNDEINGITIYASVIPKMQISVEEATLRSHVGNYLPEYAIPSKIMITDSLPRTSTGKIDRKKLKDQVTKLAN